MGEEADKTCFEAYFKAVPQSAREARDLVAVAWAHWGLGDDHTARLIVSELVGNAVAASRQSEDDLAIRVICRLVNGCCVLEVWDEVDALPEAREAMPEDVDGRGLALVSGLSDGWTVEKRPDRGKIVRVEMNGAP